MLVMHGSGHAEICRLTTGRGSFGEGSSKSVLHSITHPQPVGVHCF
jgi:hypothetical protein